MPVEFSEYGTPISEFDVAAFESEHDIVLPTKYRRFWLMHNGGVPVPCEFNFRSGPYGDSSIDRFLSLDESQERNLRSTDKVFKVLEKRVSNYLMPIADDDNGNLICIRIRGERAGKIFFWYHGEENNEDEPERNIYLPASFFNEFLAYFKQKIIPNPNHLPPGCGARNRPNL